MSSTWANLSSSELFQIAAVLGRNDKIRFDILRQIQQGTEIAGQGRSQRRAIPFSYTIRHQICFLCCRAFSGRSKPVACAKCKHNVCTTCISKLCRSVCAICALEKKVDRQRSDHRRLFHAGSDRCYDWAKIALFKIADPQALLFDECYWVFNERYWVARAIIEIRLMILFDINRLDGYSAFITLPGESLHRSARQLATLIKSILIDTLGEMMERKGKSLWSIHQDGLLRIREIIKDEVAAFCALDSLISLTPIEYSEHCQSVDFEQLLAGAVINAVIMAEMLNLKTADRGRNDPGEDDQATAIRETEEETGLKATDYRILPNFREETNYTVQKRQKTVVYFLAEMVTDPQIRLSHEHTDYVWLPLEEACNRIDHEHVATKNVLQRTDTSPNAQKAQPESTVPVQTVRHAEPPIDQPLNRRWKAEPDPLDTDSIDSAVETATMGSSTITCDDEMNHGKECAQRSVSVDSAPAPLGIAHKETEPKRGRGRRTWDSDSDSSDSDSSTDALAIAAALTVGNARRKEVAAVVPPYFIVAPRASVCNAGQKAQFYCQVGGSSPVEVKWFHNCAEIVDQDRNRLVRKGNEHWWEIFDTCPTDSGEIRCVASNEVASVDCVFPLCVSDCEVKGQKPEFKEIQEHEDVSAKTGQRRITLKFRTTGSPEPRVQFFHDGELLKFNDRVRSESTTTGHWNIVIDDPDSNDNGVYAAVSVNRFGRAKCYMELSAHQRL